MMPSEQKPPTPPSSSANPTSPPDAKPATTDSKTASAAAALSPTDVVKRYFERNMRLVFWAHVGDAKGPHEKNWTQKRYGIEDYREGMRVGIITGTEVGPDKFLHDVDIDWAPGSLIAQHLLPPTGLVFGRKSKHVSHCFYTTPDPIASFKYEDIDKTTLVELRGTKANGDLGLQTMAPPSVWSKGSQREQLAFVRFDDPAHVEQSSMLRQRVCLAAIAMLFAKHFGHNGFGHEARLCWAGFLLRLGLSTTDLVAMGEAISVFCNNREIEDVRRAVDSTQVALAHDQKKVKGGPALARMLGANGKAIIARVGEWLGRDSDFVRDPSGKIFPKHQGNVRRALDLLGLELSYNQFSEKMMLNGRPLEDHVINHAWLQIDSEYRFLPPEQFFYSVVTDTARANSFHPVLDYLEPLVWDGIPRIETWLMRAAKVEDSPYVRAISIIMLVAAVRRVREPGCKYDEMVVWESPQGGYKSSAAQALCPNPEWFLDDISLNLHSKELIESTLGKWIVEASELSGRRKAEIEQLKAMMSRQMDGPARMAYGRVPIERLRHFIFIGTTNKKAYLNDETGNRRFWPVKCKPFDVEWIKKNRDQLWAEACQRERAGTSIRLAEELWPAATEEQEKRREVDPWETSLRQTLLAIPPSGDGRRRVTSEDLWNALNITIDKRDRIGSLRMGDIMQRLGFERTRVRPAGGVVQVGFVQSDEGLEEPEGIEVEEVENTTLRDEGYGDDTKF